MTPGTVQMRRPRAMTLIETLAIVAIIALVAGVLLTNAAAMSDHAQLRAAADHILELDRRGRMLAQSGTLCALILNEETKQLKLTAQNGEIVSSSGGGWEAMNITFIDNGGQTLTALQYDALGRSIDYTFTVSLDERTLQRKLCGLTGWSPPEFNSAGGTP